MTLSSRIHQPKVPQNPRMIEENGHESDREELKHGLRAGAFETGLIRWS